MDSPHSPGGVGDAAGDLGFPSIEDCGMDTPAGLESTSSPSGFQKVKIYLNGVVKEVTVPLPSPISNATDSGATYSPIAGMDMAELQGLSRVPQTTQFVPARSSTGLATTTAEYIRPIRQDSNGTISIAPTGVTEGPSTNVTQVVETLRAIPVQVTGSNSAISVAAQTIEVVSTPSLATKNVAYVRQVKSPSGTFVVHKEGLKTPQQTVLRNSDAQNSRYMVYQKNTPQGQFTPGNSSRLTMRHLLPPQMSSKQTVSPTNSAFQRFSLVRSGAPSQVCPTRVISSKVLGSMPQVVKLAQPASVHPRMASVLAAMKPPEKVQAPEKILTIMPQRGIAQPSAKLQQQVPTGNKEQSKTLTIPTSQLQKLAGNIIKMPDGKYYSVKMDAVQKSTASPSTQTNVPLTAQKMTPTVLPVTSQIQISSASSLATVSQMAAALKPPTCIAHTQPSPNMLPQTATSPATAVMMQQRPGVLGKVIGTYKQNGKVYALLDSTQSQVKPVQQQVTKNTPSSLMPQIVVYNNTEALTKDNRPGRTCFRTAPIVNSVKPASTIDCSLTKKLELQGASGHRHGASVSENIRPNEMPEENSDSNAALDISQEDRTNDEFDPGFDVCMDSIEDTVLPFDDDIEEVEDSMKGDAENEGISGVPQQQSAADEPTSDAESNDQLSSNTPEVNENVTVDALSNVKPIRTSNMSARKRRNKVGVPAVNIPSIHDVHDNAGTNTDTATIEETSDSQSVSESQGRGQRKTRSMIKEIMEIPSSQDVLNMDRADTSSTDTATEYAHVLNKSHENSESTLEETSDSKSVNVSLGRGQRRKRSVTKDIPNLPQHKRARRNLEGITIPHIALDSCDVVRNEEEINNRLEFVPVKKGRPPKQKKLMKPNAVGGESESDSSYVFEHQKHDDVDKYGSNIISEDKPDKDPEYVPPCDASDNVEITADSAESFLEKQMKQNAAGGQSTVVDIRRNMKTNQTNRMRSTKSMLWKRSCPRSCSMFGRKRSVPKKTFVPHTVEGKDDNVIGISANDSTPVPMQRQKFTRRPPRRIIPKPSLVHVDEVIDSVISNSENDSKVAMNNDGIQYGVTSRFIVTSPKTEPPLCTKIGCVGCQITPGRRRRIKEKPVVKEDEHEEEEEPIDKSLDLGKFPKWRRRKWRKMRPKTIARKIKCYVKLQRLFIGAKKTINVNENCFKARKYCSENTILKQNRSRAFTASWSTTKPNVIVTTHVPSPKVIRVANLATPKVISAANVGTSNVIPSVSLATPNVIPLASMLTSRGIPSASLATRNVIPAAAKLGMPSVIPATSLATRNVIPIASLATSNIISGVNLETSNANHAAVMGTPNIIPAASLVAPNIIPATSQGTHNITPATSTATIPLLMRSNTGSTQFAVAKPIQPGKGDPSKKKYYLVSSSSGTFLVPVNDYTQMLYKEAGIVGSNNMGTSLISLLKKEALNTNALQQMGVTGVQQVPAAPPTPALPVATTTMATETTVKQEPISDYGDEDISQRKDTPPKITASQSVVLPSVASTSVMSPSVVSPSVVSPCVVSPSGVSPSVVSPSVVSPSVVSPSVVSPSVVSPSVVSSSVVSSSVVSLSLVSPSVVSPCVVSPSVVSSSVVSPSVVSPCVVSPSVVSSSVVSPSVMSPSVVAPSVSILKPLPKRNSTNITPNKQGQVVTVARPPSPTIDSLTRVYDELPMNESNRLEVVPEKKGRPPKEKKLMKPNVCQPPDMMESSIILDDAQPTAETAEESQPCAEDQSLLADPAVDSIRTSSKKRKRRSSVIVRRKSGRQKKVEDQPTVNVDEEKETAKGQKWKSVKLTNTDDRKKKVMISSTEPVGKEKDVVEGETKDIPAEGPKEKEKTSLSSADRIEALKAQLASQQEMLEKVRRQRAESRKVLESLSND